MAKRPKLKPKRDLAAQQRQRAANRVDQKKNQPPPGNRPTEVHVAVTFIGPDGKRYYVNPLCAATQGCPFDSPGFVFEGPAFHATQGNRALLARRALEKGLYGKDQDLLAEFPDLQVSPVADAPGAGDEGESVYQCVADFGYLSQSQQEKLQAYLAEKPDGAEIGPDLLLLDESRHFNVAVENTGALKALTERAQTAVREQVAAVSQVEAYERQALCVNARELAGGSVPAGLPPSLADLEELRSTLIGTDSSSLLEQSFDSDGGHADAVNALTARFKELLDKPYDAGEYVQLGVDISNCRDEINLEEGEGLVVFDLAAQLDQLDTAQKRVSWHHNGETQAGVTYDRRTYDDYETTRATIEQRHAFWQNLHVNKKICDMEKENNPVKYAQANVLEKLLAEVDQEDDPIPVSYQALEPAHLDRLNALYEKHAGYTQAAVAAAKADLEKNTDVAGLEKKYVSANGAAHLPESLKTACQRLEHIEKKAPEARSPSEQHALAALNQRLQAYTVTQHHHLRLLDELRSTFDSTVRPRQLDWKKRYEELNEKTRQELTDGEAIEREILQDLSTGCSFEVFRDKWEAYHTYLKALNEQENAPLRLGDLADSFSPSAQACYGPPAPIVNPQDGLIEHLSQRAQGEAPDGTPSIDQHCQLDAQGQLLPGQTMLPVKAAAPQSYEEALQAYQERLAITAERLGFSPEDLPNIDVFARSRDSFVQTNQSLSAKFQIQTLRGQFRAAMESLRAWRANQDLARAPIATANLGERLKTALEKAQEKNSVEQTTRAERLAALTPLKALEAQQQATFETAMDAGELKHSQEAQLQAASTALCAQFAENKVEEDFNTQFGEAIERRNALLTDLLVSAEPEVEALNAAMLTCDERQKVYLKATQAQQLLEAAPMTAEAGLLNAQNAVYAQFVQQYETAPADSLRQVALQDGARALHSMIKVLQTQATRGQAAATLADLPRPALGEVQLGDHLEEELKPLLTPAETTDVSKQAAAMAELLRIHSVIGGWRETILQNTQTFIPMVDTKARETHDAYNTAFYARDALATVLRAPLAEKLAERKEAFVDKLLAYDNAREALTVALGDDTSWLESLPALEALSDANASSQEALAQAKNLQEALLSSPRPYSAEDQAKADYLEAYIDGLTVLNQRHALNSALASLQDALQAQGLHLETTLPEAAHNALQVWQASIQDAQTANWGFSDKATAYMQASKAVADRRAALQVFGPTDQALDAAQMRVTEAGMREGEIAALLDEDPSAWGKRSTREVVLMPVGTTPQDQLQQALEIVTQDTAYAARTAQALSVAEVSIRLDQPFFTDFQAAVREAYVNNQAKALQRFQDEDLQHLSVLDTSRPLLETGACQTFEEIDAIQTLGDLRLSPANAAYLESTHPQLYAVLQVGRAPELTHLKTRWQGELAIDAYSGLCARGVLSAQPTVEEIKDFPDRLAAALDRAQVAPDSQVGRWGAVLQDPRAVVWAQTQAYQDLLANEVAKLQSLREDFNGLHTQLKTAPAEVQAALRDKLPYLSTRMPVQAFRLAQQLAEAPSRLDEVKSLLETPETALGLSKSEVEAPAFQSWRRNFLASIQHIEQSDRFQQAIGRQADIQAAAVGVQETAIVRLTADVAADQPIVASYFSNSEIFQARRLDDNALPTSILGARREADRDFQRALGRFSPGPLHDLLTPLNALDEISYPEDNVALADYPNDLLTKVETAREVLRAQTAAFKANIAEAQAALAWRKEHDWTLEETSSGHSGRRERIEQAEADFKTAKTLGEARLQAEATYLDAVEAKTRGLIAMPVFHHCTAKAGLLADIDSADEARKARATTQLMVYAGGGDALTANSMADSLRKMEAVQAKDDTLEATPAADLSQENAEIDALAKAGESFLDAQEKVTNSPEATNKLLREKRKKAVDDWWQSLSSAEIEERKKRGLDVLSKPLKKQDSLFRDIEKLKRYANEIKNVQASQPEAGVIILAYLLEMILRLIIMLIKMLFASLTKPASKKKKQAMDDLIAANLAENKGTLNINQIISQLSDAKNFDGRAPHRETKAVSLQELRYKLCERALALGVPPESIKGAERLSRGRTNGPGRWWQIPVPNYHQQYKDLVDHGFVSQQEIADRASITGAVQEEYRALEKGAHQQALQHARDQQGGQPLTPEQHDAVVAEVDGRLYHEMRGEIEARVVELHEKRLSDSLRREHQPFGTASDLAASQERKQAEEAQVRSQSLRSEPAEGSKPSGGSSQPPPFNFPGMGGM